MTDPTNQSGGEQSAAPLVLNALRDVISGETSFVEDRASADAIRTVYHHATTSAERGRFKTALGKFRAGEVDTESNVAGEIRPIVDAVLAAGAEQLQATVIHDAQFTVSPLDAHLYGFGTTLDDQAINALCLTTTCCSYARTGLTRTREGNYRAAADKFEDAIGAAETDTEWVSTRILAAWAHHWSGADERALELVRAALNRDVNAWSARMVGFAADDEFADLFRRGTFGMRVYLRVTADLPGSSTLKPFVGTPTEDDANIEWTALGDQLHCLVFPRLSPETHVRLRIRGRLGSFPALHGYHASLGAVNLDDTVARTVEQILLSGPATESATERVRFERFT